MPINIYYLDDEIHLCMIFEEYFSNENFQITTFSRADEALKSCAEAPPDIIFIDYRLSETTGDKVAAEIVNDNIIKVLVTGDLSIPQIELYTRVFSKPFEFNVIQEFLDYQFPH